ncbi:MAG: uridine kinase [Bacteroidota bacterium]
MVTIFYKNVLSEILNQVHRLSTSKQRVLIGIDGCGGSGKSTFAAELSGSLGAAPVIHVDDFYKPSRERSRLSSSKFIGWQFDWRRLERDVLKPLITGGEANYQRYDWSMGCLAEWRNIRTLSHVIIEGIYTLKSELSMYYDLRLWIECPRDVRLKRGLDRDGEHARSLWEDDWMQEEDRYIALCHPHLQAHKIIQGMST